MLTSQSNWHLSPKQIKLYINKFVFLAAYPLGDICFFGDGLYLCVLANIDGLMQDCSISIAIKLKKLQSCTKPSILHLLAAALLPQTDRVTCVFYFRQGWRDGVPPPMCWLGFQLTVCIIFLFQPWNTYFNVWFYMYGLSLNCMCCDNNRGNTLIVTIHSDNNLQ